MRRKRCSESKLTYICSSLRKIYLCNVVSVTANMVEDIEMEKKKTDFVVMEEQRTAPLVFRRSAGGSATSARGTKAAVCCNTGGSVTVSDVSEVSAQPCNAAFAANPRQVIQVFSLSQFGPAHTGATTLENTVLSLQTLIVQIHHICSCSFISAS